MSVSITLAKIHLVPLSSTKGTDVTNSSNHTKSVWIDKHHCRWEEEYAILMIRLEHLDHRKEGLNVVNWYCCASRWVTEESVWKMERWRGADSVQPELETVCHKERVWTNGFRKADWDEHSFMAFPYVISLFAYFSRDFRSRMETQMSTGHF